MIFVKWLRVLSYVVIISLINSVVDYLPFIPASISTWVNWVIMVATICCMFNLSCKNNRYGKVAVFRAAALGCTLISSFLFESYFLGFAVPIFSILAVYQEYAAHSEVLAEKDMTLSRRWHALFYWEIIAAILLSLGSGVAAAILVSSELQVGASSISGIVIWFLEIPRFAIQIVRLLYLNKTIACFLPGEE